MKEKSLSVETIGKKMIIKTFFTKISPLIYALIWFAVGIFSVILIREALYVQQQTICTKVDVNIDYDQGNYFVDESDIQELIRKQLPTQNIHIPIGMISLAELEQSLEKNVYIEKAEIYFNSTGAMKVGIVQKYPLARVITTQNMAYYISQEGEKMPTSRDFSARVPIISGYIEDNGKVIGKVDTTITEKLYELVAFINQDIFLHSLIEQIYVEKNQEIVLSPKLGNFTILFGSLDDIENKFFKLKVFYKEGLKNVGWNYYKQVNLKYANQVVCTKK